MGCCSSKSRTERYAAASSSSSDGSKPLDVAVAAAVDTSVCSPSVVHEHQHGDATLLMDRGDGTMVFPSDGDLTPSSPPGVRDSQHSLDSSGTRLDMESRAARAVVTAVGDEQVISGSSTVAATDSSSIDVKTEGCNIHIDNSAANVTRAVELPLQSPTADDTHTALQSSPRKAPVNFDDVPINSMYHRLHVVEAEAMDAKRQDELRAEAERHEREVREFKAAMSLVP